MIATRAAPHSFRSLRDKTSTIALREIGETAGYCRAKKTLKVSVPLCSIRVITPPPGSVRHRPVVGSVWHTVTKRSTPSEYDGQQSNRTTVTHVGCCQGESCKRPR